jgi:hypothetical protein
MHLDCAHHIRVDGGLIDRFENSTKGRARYFHKWTVRAGGIPTRNAIQMS